MTFITEIRKSSITLTAGIVLSFAPAMASSPSPKTLQAFRSDCARKAQSAAQAGRMTVAGKKGWLFFGPELHHLSVGKFWGSGAAKVSKASNPRYADPLPAILDFKKQLDKAGVELLLVPVPPKAAIYPDFLSGAVPSTGIPPRLDPNLQAFYTLLRKKGVRVLDLTSEFLTHRSGANGAVFCKQDTHWSGKACVLAAQRIAAMEKSRPWMKAIPKRKLAAQWKTVPISGDLRADLGANAPAKESLPLRFVGTKSGGRIAPVETSRASPVLLLGDSHTLVFHAGGDMLATGAGLADQLAYEFGFPVDLIGVRGSGATPARISLFRHVRSNPSYLKGKKLVIWCLTAREFTESTGWQKVPIVK
jgi:alginate O-acetyltransferase complex protein AlgJ